jgi:tRNA(fMet)-specific endonuclease VapC
VILDTNALSAVADGEAGAVRIFGQASRVEVPVIALGEYRFGIAQSRRHAEYEEWLGQLIAATGVLPVDQETSGHYARIRGELRGAGQSIPSNDLWIAALTRQHRLPLMSQDRHFDAVRDLQRISW